MIVEYSEFKTYVTSIGIEHLVRYYYTNNIHYISVQDAGVLLNCEIRDDETTNKTDFEANIKPSANSKVNTVAPFADKKVDGKSLFSRTEGKEYAVVVGSNFLEYDVPYTQVKFNEIQIINGEVGDVVNLKVLDDDQGTYSTVPFYPLNQFGYTVNVAPTFYTKDSNYDADLYYNMTIFIEYISESAKTVYVNYGIHEVK